MENRFETQVQKIFKGYRFEQYREAPGKGKFVEFWLVSEDQPATTSVDLAQVKKLAKLLGSQDISITGGNFGEDNENTNVLVTAMGVKFGARRKRSRSAGRDLTASGL